MSSYIIDKDIMFKKKSWDVIFYCLRVIFIIFVKTEALYGAEMCLRLTCSSPWC